MKRLKPLNDVIFKKLFGEMSNKRHLIGFLSAVLGQEIKDVEIKGETLQRDLIDDKLGILDIKAVLSTGEKVNIEVQRINEYNIVNRTMFYWSKLFVENFKVRGLYQELNKTITISILGFNNSEDELFHSSYHIYEDKTKKLLSDVLEIHFIEMKKFEILQPDYQNPLHRWLLFLQETIDKDRLEEIIKMDENIRSAEEELMNLSMDEETRRKYELSEKFIADEASRMYGAKEEGKKEVALSLLKQNVPFETISIATGFSIEELKKMK